MEEETEEKYKNIVQFCRQNHTSFVDYEFPPNDESIGKELIEILNERKIANLIWLRPSQIVTLYNDEDKWNVFDNPKSMDVVQVGIIGNCSYIAAMSVVAELPHVLDNLFPSKEYSPEGVYRVRLYIAGKWKTLIVDDHFPCQSNTNKRATVAARRKQLWVSLLEKALAKQFGSYSQLNQGAPLNLPLLMLTGANCTIHWIPKHPDDIDLFWKTLMSAQNPHGLNEWAGKWSKTWDGWPDSMKEEFSIDKKDGGGTFWMELDDFMETMSDVTICRIRLDWHTFREELTVGLDTPTIRITVMETCEASFATFTERSPTSNTKAEMMISVHRISNEKNYVGEMIGRSARSYCFYTTTDELLLTPGQYIIILFDLKNLNKTNSSRVVVCHSSRPIVHELVQQTPQMYNQAIREIVLKDGKLKTNTEFGIYLRFLNNDINGMIVMADNFLENKYLQLSLNGSRSTNASLSRNSFKTIDIIPPMSYQIIMVMSRKVFEKPSQRCVANSWNVSCDQFIDEDDSDYEDLIVPPNAQHYPVIDPLDPIHYPQSIFYDSPINVSTRKKCQKRIKHLLKKCDCII